MSTDTNAAFAGQLSVWGHPRGLATLFFTEMWERCSYYGMRAILVLFMVDQLEDGGLGFSDPTANAIYGLYIAAVYVVALPGGWIADRLIGAQRAVWFGGIVIMCGHFVLAIPGLTSFFGGLILVVLGTGLLKPNISAIVGELYAPGDPHRDGGFTIFYMGINVGAAVGPIVCGWLARDDWHYGFAAAGIGMLVGLIQFHLTRSQLGAAGFAPGAPISRERRRGTWAGLLLSVCALASVFTAAIRGWIQFDPVPLARGASYGIVAVAAVYFAHFFLMGRLTKTERNRVLVIVVLFLASAVFWSGFEQAGSSLNLFAERYTVRDLDSFEVPASWFQSLNPVFIVLLAPLYSALWVGLARRHLDPSTPVKFAMGLIMLGLGFAIMIGAATSVAEGNRVLPTWLFFTYLLHTMGELALSPVGLSSISKLAPRRFVGQMMGVWFLSLSLGGIIAGLVAGEFRADAVDEMPALYAQIVISTLGAGVLLVVLAKPLRRLMGGVT